MKITHYSRQKTEIPLANLQAVLRKKTERSKSSIKKKQLIEGNCSKMKQNLVFHSKSFPEF